jgi:hypothetical protein
MSKNAIIAFAIGNHCRVNMKRAQLWFESLRTLGEFDGDLIFLHGKMLQGTTFPDELNVTTHQIGGWRPFKKARANIFKLVINKHIDLSGYDLVLGMDCDLCAMGPVSVLFDEFTGGVQAMQVERPFSKWFDESDHSSFKGRAGFNSGVILTEGSQFASLCEQWLSVHMEREKTLRRFSSYADQHSFNLMALRGVVEVNPFEEYRVMTANPVAGYDLKDNSVYPKTRIIHYTGKKPGEKVAPIYWHYYSRLGIPLGAPEIP